MKTRTNTIVKVGLLAAISTILYFIEIGVVFIPSFLKLDLSDLPAVIGAFALGPIAGIAIELVKNLIHAFRTQSGFVGEFANFIIGISFVIPAGLIYRHNKSKIGAILALGAGVVIMGIMGNIMNYFVLIPFYVKVGFPLSEIIKLSHIANPYVTDLNTLIMFGILPFNILKGITISLFTVLLYKKISPVLHRQ